MHIQHDWHSSSFFQKYEHFRILLLSDVDTLHEGFGSLYIFHNLFVGALFDHLTGTSNLSNATSSGIADLHNEKVFSVRFGDGEQVNLAPFRSTVAELADGDFFLLTTRSTFVTSMCP